MAILTSSYGETLPSQGVDVAAQWISTLTVTPARAQILARHELKDHGHFEKGTTQANSELALLRAACR